MDFFKRWDIYKNRGNGGRMGVYRRTNATAACHGDVTHA